MSWWLIVYVGINIIISTGCTIITANDGYYTNWNNGKILWGKATLIFVVLMIFGLPIIIVGMVVLTIWG